MSKIKFARLRSVSAKNPRKRKTVKRRKKVTRASLIRNRNRRVRRAIAKKSRVRKNPARRVKRRVLKTPRRILCAVTKRGAHFYWTGSAFSNLRAKAHTFPTLRAATATANKIKGRLPPQIDHLKTIAP